MDIIVHLPGQIIVDHQLHAADVETARCYRGGHQDGLRTALEVLESLKPLTEEPVTVDAVGLESTKRRRNLLK